MLLPSHADRFHFNLGFARFDSGFSTHLGIWNYFCAPIFECEQPIAAILDFELYMPNGQLAHREFRKLPARASERVDLGQFVDTRSWPVGGIGAIYARLIPETLPTELDAAKLPTEFMVEIAQGNGGAEFFHNTLGRRNVPGVGQMTSGFLVADRSVFPRYIVLVNNYFGPSIPFLRDGVAEVSIANHRGERRLVRSKRIPQRGSMLFDMRKTWPDIEEFLGGMPGTITVRNANLLNKPWVWFEGEQSMGKHADTSFSIDHL